MSASIAVADTHSHPSLPEEPSSHTSTGLSGPSTSSKKGRKPKKAKSSADVVRFPWHKYPEATRFLCKIKDQLLDPALSKQQRSDLKKDTANALLAWWHDHTAENKNQGDMRVVRSRPPYSTVYPY